MSRRTEFKKSLCADIDGFSLHAAVRCGADDRQALEALCRHILRPALANGRVQTSATGQMMFELKAPLREPRRAGAQRQAARAVGAAKG